MLNNECIRSDYYATAIPQPMSLTWYTTN